MKALLTKFAANSSSDTTYKSNNAKQSKETDLSQCSDFSIIDRTYPDFRRFLIQPSFAPLHTFHWIKIGPYKTA